MSYEALPGGDLIEKGLRDLASGSETEEALLVSIGAARLKAAGVPIPHPMFEKPERRLYELLAREDEDSAHSRYNALLRRLVSFEDAAECAGRPVDAARIREFLRALGAEAREDTQLYLTGGTTAVLFGWRATTVDLDIKMVPERDALFRAIPALKDQLEVNVELASPADFIPELPGWQERSRFIVREGRVDYFHYDFYAQALSKLQRGHAKDFDDVREMIERGLVEPQKARELFGAVEGQLYRFPSIDPASFRRRVEGALPRV